MEYQTKSVVFGRKPRQEGCEFKTAFFKLYNSAKPLEHEFPDKELDFRDVEKVELRNEDLDYYLEGNDLVMDNIKSITIDQKGNTLHVKVKK
jgi:hypothetical protein